MWVANVLGAALLPEPISPMRRKRLAPRPEVCALICKCALDKILWADVCYGIIAEGNGRQAPPKILAPFTSVARLREIEPGIIALIERLGRVRGGKRSLDTFLKKVYKYEAKAKAVSQTDKGATIAEAIQAVLSEAAAAGAATWLSDDPTHEPTLHMVQPGSGGEAKLDEAIAELPQTSSVVAALLKAVSPAQAASLGLSTQIGQAAGVRCRRARARRTGRRTAGGRNCTCASAGAGASPGTGTAATG